MTAAAKVGAADGPGVLRDPAAWLFGGVVAVGLLQLALLDLPTGRTLTALAAPTAAVAVVTLGHWTGAGRDDGAGRRWLTWLAVLECGLALWAIAAFLVALPVGVGQPSGFYRIKVLVTTPLGDHNTAAGLLLVGVVATAVLVEEDRRWWAGVALTTVGIVACLSRGAAVVLLASAVGAVVVGTRRGVGRRLLTAGLAAVALVTVAATVLDASPPPGADVPEGWAGTSVVGRLDLAARGIDVALDHPLLGVGLGAFGDHAADLPPPNDHAHNAVAHAAAEGGAVLLALVVALVVLLAVRGLRAPSGWRRDVAVVGGAALVAHAQIDVLGGLLGTELLLAALLVLVTPSPLGARVGLRPAPP